MNKIDQSIKKERKGCNKRKVNKEESPGFRTNH
jgi:hypothetical protein